MFHHYYHLAIDLYKHDERETIYRWVGGYPRRGNHRAIHKYYLFLVLRLTSRLMLFFFAFMMLVFLIARKLIVFGCVYWTLFFFFPIKMLSDVVIKLITEDTIRRRMKRKFVAICNADNNGNYL